MKRILLLIPNLDFGGAQNSFARVSILLKPFCSLRLVVFNKENIAPLVFGSEVVELKVPASRTTFEKLVNFFKRVSRLRKIKREFKPDISISFLEGADYVNLLSRLDDQIMFYIHGSKLHDKNIRGLIGSIRKKILLPFFYRRANKLLVVNSEIADELKKYFRLSASTFECMPNFYDFEELNRLGNGQLGLVAEKFFSQYEVVCVSGRLAPEKGIDKMVELLPVLFKKHPLLKLVLVGDGNEKATIQNALQNLNILYAEFNPGNLPEEVNEKVIFFGYQSNPYPLLKRSTLLLLPSLNEGMPNTIVEAMGLGIPVVAADCPYGPRTLLSTHSRSDKWPDFAEFGVLCPVLTKQTAYQPWVDAIHTLLIESDLRENYRAAGLTRASDFSQERMTDRWKELLKL